MNDLKTDIGMILRKKCLQCGCEFTSIGSYSFCPVCVGSQGEILEVIKEETQIRVIENGKVGSK